MEGFVERMTKELEELNMRISKLNQFITGNILFKNLSVDEQNDLKEQHRVMEVYAMILKRRLDRYIKTN